jgi:hypothetical protein
MPSITYTHFAFPNTCPLLRAVRFFWNALPLCRWNIALCERVYLRMHYKKFSRFSLSRVSSSCCEDINHQPESSTYVEILLPQIFTNCLKSKTLNLCYLIAKVVFFCHAVCGIRFQNIKQRKSDLLHHLNPICVVTLWPWVSRLTWVGSRIGLGFRV